MERWPGHPILRLESAARMGSYGRSEAIYDLDGVYESYEDTEEALEKVVQTLQGWEVRSGLEYVESTARGGEL